MTYSLLLAEFDVFEEVKICLTELLALTESILA